MRFGVETEDRTLGAGGAKLDDDCSPKIVLISFATLRIPPILHRLRPSQSRAFSSQPSQMPGRTWIGPFWYGAGMLTLLRVDCEAAELRYEKPSSSARPEDVRLCLVVREELRERGLADGSDGSETTEDLRRAASACEKDVVEGRMGEGDADDGDGAASIDIDGGRRKAGMPAGRTESAIWLNVAGGGAGSVAVVVLDVCAGNCSGLSIGNW